MEPTLPAPESKSVYTLQPSPIKTHFNILSPTSGSIKWHSPSGFPTRVVLRWYFSHFNWRISIYPLSVRYIRDSVVATGWTVRGSSAGGDEIFRNRPEGPWGPPSLLYNGYRVFSVVKAVEACRWLPTPFYRRSYRKSRVIPLFPLWSFVCLF